METPGCGGNPEAAVVETDDEVRVSVTTGPTGSRCSGSEDCQDGLEVRFKAPLGNRRLIDESTGREVAPP
jgi:hypothetical protein